MSKLDIQIPSTIPRQKISTSLKNDDWTKDCALYWENRLINKNSFNQSDKIKMVNNCNMYYHNILDTGEVARICNPNNIKDFELPLDFKHYKIENPKIQTLKGEELKRRFDWKVYVSNRDAISKKEEQKKDQYFQFISEKIKSESFNEESAKIELEKLNEYINYDWQDLREKTADELLHHFNQYLDLKTQFSRAWEHGLINSEEIISVDEHNGKPVVEACDPKTVYWLSSPENPYIDDSDAVVRVYYLPLGQVIDYYYEFLTGAEIDELEAKQSERAGQSQDFTFNQFYSKSDEGFLIPDQNSLNLTVGGTNFEGWYDTNGNIRVVHTRWKSLRKVGKLTFYDEQGDEQTRYVDENYKIDKSTGETIEWFWPTEAWENTRIGENIFVKGKPRNVQFRKLDNISYSSLGYIGTRLDNGLFDIMKDYSIKFDAYMWRTEQAMIKSLGKIAKLDLSLIPDGWDIDQTMHFATRMGWMVIDSFKEGKKGASQGKLAGGQSGQNDVINMEQGQFIQQNMMMLTYLENQLDKLVGINDQRQGQIASDAGLQVTREASQASSNITESYYALHDNIKLRTLRALLEVAKWCLREKKESIQYITSENVAKIFEVDGQLINEADFGILIGDSSNDLKLIQSLQRATEIGLQTGEVDLIQMLDINSNESTSSIRRKIEKSVNDKKQQAQANQEQQSKDLAEQRAHEAQLHQEELESRQADRDLKRYEIDTRAQTDIHKAEISALGFAKDTDVNDNLVPDVLEQGKLALEQQKHQSDIFSRQMVESNKSKQHDDKVKLEDRKLKVKKDIEELKIKNTEIQNKNQIALANKKAKLDKELAEKKLKIEKYKASKSNKK